MNKGTLNQFSSIIWKQLPSLSLNYVNGSFTLFRETRLRGELSLESTNEQPEVRADAPPPNLSSLVPPTRPMRPFPCSGARYVASRSSTDMTKDKGTENGGWYD